MRVGRSEEGARLATGGEKDTVKTGVGRGEEGCRGRYGLLLPRKREPVKALILNTWVTSQYLDALTRVTDISPPGVA